MKTQPTFNPDALPRAARQPDPASCRRRHERLKSHTWRRHSQDIALLLSHHFRIRGLGADSFARMAPLSPSEIRQCLAGTADLTLSQIAALEKALGVTLIEVPRPYEHTARQ